jgi:hypothetical protein
MKLFCWKRACESGLSAMTVKTDRKDARGLAQLIQMAWFRPVHAKSIRLQEVRALLVARKQLLGRLIDVELSIRGILRGFGPKVGPVTHKGFDARIRGLVTGQATFGTHRRGDAFGAGSLKVEYERLHKTMFAIVRGWSVLVRNGWLLQTSCSGPSNLYYKLNNGATAQAVYSPPNALLAQPVTFTWSNHNVQTFRVAASYKF